MTATRQAFARDPYYFRRQYVRRPFPLVAAGLLLLGVVLRLGFWTWQPLWADEGYSVYFATEPVGRLLWLTAHDIHPPLYYLLLHGWLQWWPPTPFILRCFSVLLATPVLLLALLLARTLFPGRQRPQILFLLLLIGNPLYLYYSQEIRMYGLAMTWSLATTLCAWRWLQSINQGKQGAGWLFGYIITATLALYTLYYLAFLLLAHLFWLLWQLRRRVRHCGLFVVADSLVALLYLPWVLYTTRIVIAYVNDKVRSDQDVALGPWTYLLRHLVAFTSGHLPFPTPLLSIQWLASLCVIGLLLWSLWTLRKHPSIATMPAPQAALWLFGGVPFCVGFLINRFYPFFPEGGERLLLFTLPYFLLLVATAIADLWQRWAIGCMALFVLIVPAILGSWLFYTLPRYSNDDYRPLIRQIVQQGTDADTLLATFPWQVGFWRAYAPPVGLTGAAGPKVQLISDRSIQWGPAVATLIDEALAQGMLWIPSLRSIGSTLPAAMDDYATGRAVNFVHQWVGTTTLDAWHRPAVFAVAPVVIDWGMVQLTSVGVTTTTLPSANSPLMIAFEWQTQANLPAAGVTLRLQKDGHTWASRDYKPLGSLALAQSDNRLREQVGFIIPAGLPPGDYQLALGLVDTAGELYPPLRSPALPARLTPLTTVTITAPSQPLPPFRLPIQHPLPQPVSNTGVVLLGYSGEQVVMAGTQLDLTLFWQSQAALPERQLYVSLLAANGVGVAGWEGWPLSNYPLSPWLPGALVQTPAAVVVPPTIVSGRYRLVTGLLDPASGVKTSPLVLGEITVQQRQANFTPPQPPTMLTTPAQFGTHVQLLGYGVEVDNEQMQLALYWQVLQPLWPPHHLFVHLDQADGVTVAQADGAPQTADGPVPTGSWQPGEYLVTQHRLTTGAIAEWNFVLRVGLYLPATEVRLPLSLADTPAGDAFVIEFRP